MTRVIRCVLGPYDVRAWSIGAVRVDEEYASSTVGRRRPALEDPMLGRNHVSLCLKIALAAASAGVVLGGCETGPKGEAPDAGLEALGAGGSRVAEPTGALLTTDAEVARLAEQAVQDLEELKASRALQPRRPNLATIPLEIESPDAKPSVKASAGPANDESVVSINEARRRAAQAAATKPASPEAPALEPTPTEPALTPRGAVAAELGRVVAKAIGVLKAEPEQERVIGELVGAIEAFYPGFLVGIEDAGSALRGALGQAGAAEILAQRQHVPAKEVAAAAPATSEKPPEEVAPPAKPPLTISGAQLCSRVMSFGRYEPLATEVFVAGEPMRA